MLKDTNPKDAVGVRKWRQYCTVPITVVWELGVAMLEGARKYGRHNYRVAGVRASVYVDAAKGHIDSWWEGEDVDSDSGLSHITKAMASLAVLRDAMINDMVTDDRPPKVKNFAQFKADMQEAVEDIMERHPDALEPFTELGQQAARLGVPTVTREEVEARLAEEKSRGVLRAKREVDYTWLTTPVQDERMAALRVTGKPMDEAWVDEADLWDASFVRAERGEKVAPGTWNAEDADFVDQEILSVPRRVSHVVAHRAFEVELIHPDDPEFDRLHVWGGLTTKQLCRLVLEEAPAGQGCGMNHTSRTGNLTIYLPDQFDALLRRVMDRVSQQDSYECRLDWPDGGFRECSTRLTAADWFKACPGVRVTPRPKRSLMKPKGGPA